MSHGYKQLHYADYYSTVSTSYSLTCFLCLHDGNEIKIINKMNHLDSLLQL